DDPARHDDHDSPCGDDRAAPDADDQGDAADDGRAAHHGATADDLAAHFLDRPVDLVVLRSSW
ncbi:MAG: hypothetical protein JO085_07240, partial [Acidimicrobiia bacterium]|nr:hypothetical protein [Acidimicrobiia bacterium]